MTAQLQTQTFYKHIKLGGKPFTLGLNKVQYSEKTEKFDRIHHIHILDRSGSMSSVIGQLMDNVKLVVGTMGKNDLLSIIWFSGEGQASVLLKGASKSDKEGIDNLLDSIKSTIGCTCFSQPLKLANEVISDLKALCPNFSVNLFTDGEPCVSYSVNQEVEYIFKQLEEMTPNILAFNTIGYTKWADEKLLTDMSATSAFGRYIFSNDIKDYNEIFGNNYKRIQGLGAILYECESDGADFYYRDDNTFAFKSNKIKLYTSDKFQVLEVLKGTKNLAEGYKEISDKDLEDFLYQMAYEAYYRGNQEFAYDCLASLGDKYAAELLLKSFTSEERANAVKTLLAMAYGKKRYEQGKHENLEIPDTMFCVFDLLNMLKDEIFIPSKDYNRIGVKRVDTNNIFQLNDEQEYTGKFADNLVFASDRANVSVRYVMKGQVRLLATAARRVGLPEKVDSTIFRTQTIIKDGELNTKKLNAWVSNKTLQNIKKRCTYYGIDYDKLVNKVAGKNYQDKVCVEFNLTELPIINRRGRNVKIEDISSLVKRQNELKARQKILRSFIKNEVFNAEGESYNDEQLAVLKDHGIVKGIYSGIKLESEDPIFLDYNIVRSMDFQQKGWASLPKIEDAINKSNVKPGTPASYIKEVYLNEYEAIKDNTDKVNEELSKVKEELFDVTDALSVARLYKIVSGGFFEGLEMVADNKYEYKSNENPDMVLVVKTDYIKIPVSSGTISDLD